MDDQPAASSSFRTHTFSSNRLQRQSLAALKRHLQSLDKAAAAPVVITLSQPSQSHLTVDDESLDMAAAATALLIGHTYDRHIVLPARGSSSSASVGVGSSSLSSSSASSYTTPSYTSSYTTTSYAASLQQPSQQLRPHFVRRSARNAASLCRRTSSRANVDDYDEATRQKLLALYRRAGNCLRFRVSLILCISRPAHNIHHSSSTLPPI